jgi:hypothetical protein
MRETSCLITEKVVDWKFAESGEKRVEAESHAVVEAARRIMCALSSSERYQRGLVQLDPSPHLGRSSSINKHLHRGFLFSASACPARLLYNPVQATSLLFHLRQQLDQIQPSKSTARAPPLKSPVMDRLSTELDENIIGRLDKAALNALSKTSTYYRNLAEAHLYRGLIFSVLQYPPSHSCFPQSSHARY